MYRFSEGSGLDHATLILNKSWIPIDATTARNALVDVVSGKAQIVCPETYEMHDIESWMDRKITEGSPVIQTVRAPIQVPEVIVNQYGKMPKRSVVFSRRNLWRRDHWTCQYCGNRPKPDEITVDHVLPKSRGGITTFENCVLACVSCNKKKDNHTPGEAGMKLKTIPKTPCWSPIYAVKRKHLPQSWSKFVQSMVDDLYWNSPLEP